MDLPLLEDDLGAPGMIEPTAVRRARADFPDAAVLCFFPEILDALAADGARRLARLVEDRRPVWAVPGYGAPLAVAQPGIGGPSAVLAMEELIALGCRRFVAVGGAGALLPELTMGHALVVGSAVRDEGTSFHYAPPGRLLEADPAGVAALVGALDAAGLPHRVCRTWTTDAVYRETRDRVRRRTAEGCAVVEMEAAAFLAVARYRRVGFAQLLLAADSLAGEEWQHRGWTTAHEIRAALFRVAATTAPTLP